LYFGYLLFVLSVPARVELEFGPSLDVVSVVRRFVGDFYGRVLDEDLTSRMALATHELLENAIKYSTRGETRLSIRVEPPASGARVSIQTSNRATSENLRLVADAIEAMKRSQDPFAYYQEAMRRSARRSEGSGLGLARVRAEAEMSLECDISDERLTLTARCVGEGGAGDAS